MCGKYFENRLLVRVVRKLFWRINLTGDVNAGQMLISSLNSVEVTRAYQPGKAGLLVLYGDAGSLGSPVDERG
ncbi:hypothetical protein MLPF_3423 [Mycobacterium lepromatosis]|nr:hypothetical protein MLPF_3423 [Mycobacterium lepromatosis]